MPSDSAGAHKDVFVVSRHPDHFVRHDLPDGENQIMRSVGNQPVDLNRNAVVDLSFRHFLDECSRHFAQRGESLSPVVNAEQAARRFAEHRFDFFIGHRVVRADGRQNIDQAIPVIFPCQFCQRTRLRMVAREIGRDRKHALPLAETVQRGEERLPDFIGREHRVGLSRD